MNTKPGIGRAIRVIRAVRGITQKELAEKVGVKPSYISLLEAGKRNNPSTEFLIRLSKAACVSKIVITALSMDHEELRAESKETKINLGRFLLGFITHEFL
ncbi:MAG: helix-turn-helix transcriptional regulator [Lentisphaeria bacterium]|jgi:transcriptional regulator with XRE-family HTH domain